MAVTLEQDIIPYNDEQRLDALRRLQILNTVAEAAFDNITKIVAQVFNAPMSFISLVDKDQVFYKSQVGPFGRNAVLRQDSLCSYTILDNEPLVIEDASIEACFQDNPYVAAPGGLRFYAGAPLTTKEGYQIGTVCIVDTKPRTFSETDKSLLMRFAQMVMHDIELRHIAILQAEGEEALIKNKERFELVAKATHDAVWDWNLQTDEVWWNEGFKELFGYSEEEIEPTVDSWYNRVHPEDRDRVEGGIRDVIGRGGKNWSDEYRFRRKDGSYAVVLDRGYAVLDENGQPYRMLGSMQDITQRKEVESAIRESEQRFQNLVQNATVGIVLLVGEQMKVEVVNESYAKLIGRTAKDLYGKYLFDIIPEAEAAFRPIIDGVRQSGEPYYLYGAPYSVLVDGNQIEGFLNLVYQPYREANSAVSGVMVLCQDVTEQVQTRKKIEESQQRFYSLANSITQLAWIADAKGWIHWYNDRWYAYTGTTLEEMEGWGWGKVHHPDHIDRVVSFIKEAWLKDEPWELIFPLRRHDGVYRWFLTRGVPVRNKEGKVIQWIGTNTDIDDQKQAEVLLEQRVQERTRELEMRNRELEQFTYISHHDLQEPLRKIAMFTDMVKAEAQEKLSEASRTRLNKVSNAASRMSTALRDVLDFASLNKAEQFVAVDLDEVLAGVQSDLELVINEKKATIISDTLPTIKGVRNQMHQLLYNLLNNALKFSKSGEPPRIIITCTELQGLHLADYKDLNKNKTYYKIAFQDNGIGFNQNHADKIFSMFQRLHSREAFAGTGIGLALVKKVVSNHGGRVWAEGIEGVGATFKIVLPFE